MTVIWFWVLKAAVSETADSSTEENADDESEEEDFSKPAKVSGWQMEYDAVRKLAQGLGVDLAKLSRPSGIITITGKVVGLRTVQSRENALLGVVRKRFAGTESCPAQPFWGAQTERPRKRKPKEPNVAMKSVGDRQADLTDQLFVEPDSLFASIKDQRTLLDRLIDDGSTTLDRPHQAMILFGTAQVALLGPFLSETGMAPNLRFWRLAQALSALYPAGTEEKSAWVDGVLGRKKGWDSER